MRVYEGARELRITCKHDDLLPSLREYDPHRETREIECGIPVKRFCRGTEKYGEEVLGVSRVLCKSLFSMSYHSVP